MSYKLKVPESDVFGEGKYTNGKGHTECAYFVQQATGAPQTTSWRAGLKVSEAKRGDIARGTAIATFNDEGKYPTDTLGYHAAVYLEHNMERILVLDQWNAQGEVLQRPIMFHRPKGTRRSNNADTFYVIEPQ